MEILGQPGQNRMHHGYVEITACPEGDAPKWVREQWVGMTLELAAKGIHEIEAVGVLSKTQSFWSRLFFGANSSSYCMKAYKIDGAQAVSRLRHVSSEAAEWWHNNVPDTCVPGSVLLFEEEVCRPVETRLPANV